MRLFLLLLLTVALAMPTQAQRRKATVWFYRDRSLFCSICGVTIHIPNQPSFDIRLGQTVKFDLNSTGDILIHAEISTSGGTFTRNVLVTAKPGQDYYILASATRGVELQDAKEATRFINKAKPISKEEDRVNPINNSGLDEDAMPGARTATGFLVSRNGLLLTNHHVIRKAQKVTVKGIGGDFMKPHPARVVASDPDNDLALVQLEETGLAFDTIPYGMRPEPAETGEEVFVLGYPLSPIMGDEIKLTNGVVSARSGYQGDLTALQISAAAQPGNSGSPLFDKNGNLVGVINSGINIQVAQGVTYAIKANYLRALFQATNHQPEVTQMRTQLSGKSLAQQVRQVTPFVFLIEVQK